MKRKLACALAVMLTVAAFGTLSACGIGDNGVGGIKYEQVLSAQGKKELAADETHTFELNEKLKNKEYLRLVVKTDVHLFGTFTYVSEDEPNKEITEDFFIEQSNGVDEVEFKQFLDSYRPNGVGQKATFLNDGSVKSERFNKILKKISLTNVSGVAGAFSLESFSISDRQFPTFEREIYIEKDELKVGADLQVGGTLTYLERTSYGGVSVDEVIDQNDNVYIGVNAKENAKEVLSSHVNLINIYDQGRQIQQSYYANVGGTSADTPQKMEALGLWDNPAGPAFYEAYPEDYGANGYERGLCITADSRGYYWPYNPVQGGDCAENSSQIIDYTVTDNEIYIKTRAMDWAKGDFIDPIKRRNFRGTTPGGVTTKSYMENWYTIKGGMLFVKNRFIDWNGFEGMATVPVHSNELPATYVSHPLHNYVCYTGNYAWTNDDLTYKPSLGSWAAASHQNHNPPEGWFAWVNDDDLIKDSAGNVIGGGFGVGMYIPNTKLFASGRSNATTYKDYSGNSNALNCPLLRPEFKFNKPDAASPYTSCYVGNTSYTAPVVSWTMKNYVEMTYEYAISVDYVSVMREQFKGIKEEGIMTNASLDAWN
ncbi:MAG: hypothetical protein IJ308_03925 [Clostridia bacterium]|nr:hypothetical protein [Clostridia bacterium]